MTTLARNRNLLGILTLAVGVFVFSLQDAIIKAVSGDYPVTEVVFIRCVVAFPLLAVMVRFEVGLRRIFSPNVGMMVIRGAILLVAYTTYFMALPALPLAQAIALYFMAPIFITLLSGPMLGERASKSAWAAVVVGFAGVLIILQPGTDLFEPAALFSLVSAATYALSMVLARKIGVAEPTTVMSFYQNAVYLVGAGLIAAFCWAAGITHFNHPSLDFLVRPWIIPAPMDFLLMSACGAIAAVGMALLTQAYRMAQANIVAVLEYSGMIWGPLWGFLIFDEFPRNTTFAGTALIIGAGIFAVRSATTGNKA